MISPPRWKRNSTTSKKAGWTGRRWWAISGSRSSTTWSPPSKRLCRWRPRSWRSAKPVRSAAARWCASTAGLASSSPARAIRSARTRVGTGPPTGSAPAATPLYWGCIRPHAGRRYGAWTRHVDIPRSCRARPMSRARRQRTTSPRKRTPLVARRSAGPDMAARQSRHPTAAGRMPAASPARDANPDVAGFLRALDGARGASRHTLAAYGRDLSQFSGFVHGQAVTAWDQVTPQLARRYVASLSRRYARSAIARQLSAVRTFFRFLYREGKVSQNPLVLVSTPRRQRRLPTFLTPDEVRMVLA